VTTVVGSRVGHSIFKIANVGTKKTVTDLWAVKPSTFSALSWQQFLRFDSQQDACSVLQPGAMPSWQATAHNPGPAEKARTKKTVSLAKLRCTTSLFYWTVIPRGAILKRNWAGPSAGPSRDAPLRLAHAVARARLRQDSALLFIFNHKLVAFIAHDLSNVARLCLSWSSLHECHSRTNGILSGVQGPFLFGAAYAPGLSFHGD
jgi:hypothetical protein